MYKKGIIWTRAGKFKKVQCPNERSYTVHYIYTYHGFSLPKRTQYLNQLWTICLIVYKCLDLSVRLGLCMHSVFIIIILNGVDIGLRINNVSQFEVLRMHV